MIGQHATRKQSGISTVLGVLMGISLIGGMVPAIALARATIVVDSFDQSGTAKGWNGVADGKISAQVVAGAESPVLRVEFDLKPDGWGGFVERPLDPAIDLSDMLLLTMKARSDTNEPPTGIGIKLIEEDGDKWEIRVDPGHGEWLLVEAWLDEFGASWDSQGDKLPFNTPVIRIELFAVKEKDGTKVPGWFEVDDIVFTD
ncbi:MAG: hypothetical protein ACM3VX_02235 [Bacteroidota bacterium]